MTAEIVDKKVISLYHRQLTLYKTKNAELIGPPTAK